MQEHIRQLYRSFPPYEALILLSPLFNLLYLPLLHLLHVFLVPLPSEHIVSLYLVHDFHRSEYRVLHHIRRYYPGVELTVNKVFVLWEHVDQSVWGGVLGKVFQEFEGALTVVQFVCGVRAPFEGLVSEVNTVQDDWSAQRS